MMNFLSILSRRTPVDGNEAVRVSVAPRRIQSPPPEALPDSGLLGIFPGSYFVWVPPPSQLRVATEARDALPVDVSYSFSREDARHYLSSELVDKWALSPVVEYERGDPLYRIHVSARGPSGVVYDKDLVCGVSPDLSADEMTIGRPSALAASILRPEPVYRPGRPSLLAGF